MPQALILASGSEIRQTLLAKAGVIFDVVQARVDEDMIRDALLADGASPRDIADALAEAKARKVSGKFPQSMVIGCDQVLDFDGQIIGKPETKEALLRQLQNMQGKGHDLLSAVVIYEGGEPVWRHVGKVRMTMRQMSEQYLAGYVERNWESVQHAAGGYMLEEEGVRLFSQVNGDYFTVLGLPMVELLSYLGLRGKIEQ